MHTGHSSAQKPHSLYSVVFAFLSFPANLQLSMSNPGAAYRISLKLRMKIYNNMPCISAKAQKGKVN